MNHDEADPCHQGIARINAILEDAASQGRIDTRDLTKDTWYSEGDQTTLGYRVNLEINGEWESVSFRQEDLRKAADERYFRKKLAPRIENLLSLARDW